MKYQNNNSGWTVIYRFVYSIQANIVLINLLFDKVIKRFMFRFLNRKY